MIKLSDIKKGSRWKAIKDMTDEQLLYYNNYIKKCRDNTKHIEEYINYRNSLCDETKIVSPMYIPIRNKNSPDKVYSLNMNAYRNRHHMVNNNLKRRYKELMGGFLKGKVYSSNLHLHYIVYRRIEVDGMNVASIVSKFLLDTMQDKGYIVSDKISNITESYENGGQDKKEPRVEILLYNK